MTLIKNKRFDLDRWLKSNPKQDPRNWEQIEIPDWRDDWTPTEDQVTWIAEFGNVWTYRVWTKNSVNINGMPLPVFCLVLTQSTHSSISGRFVNIVSDERDPRQECKWTLNPEDAHARLLERAARSIEINPSATTSVTDL